MKRRGFFSAIIGASGNAAAADVLATVPEPDRAKAIEISPERAYVIEYDSYLPVGGVEAMRDAWKRLLGESAPPLVVLQGGMKLSELNVATVRGYGDPVAVITKALKDSGFRK